MPMVENMLATAAQELKQDLADHVLFAYGGNGGLFACGVAERAGLHDVYLVALGQCSAPLARRCPTSVMFMNVSFPVEAFAGNLENLPLLPAGVPNLGLLTSAEDVPATADVKHLAQGLDAIRYRFSPQRPTHETLAHPG
jgi:hypothetical protein